MLPFFTTPRGRTGVIITGIVAVLLAFAAFVRHVTQGALPIGTGLNAPTNAYLSVQDAVVQGRVRGQTRWRVRARSLLFSQDRTTVTAEGVHDGVLLGGDGRPALSLSAARAVFQAPPGDAPGTPDSLRQGVLTLTGSITAGVLRAGGPTITGQQLTWNGTLGQAAATGTTAALFPPGPAPLGGLRLSADALVWTERDGTLRIPGTVRAQFHDGGTATGQDAQADTYSGDFQLHTLHAAFAAAPGTVGL